MFAKRLKTLRVKAGATQSQLAEAAGVSVDALRSYEHGKRQPTWQADQALADALAVSTERLRDRPKPRARKAKAKGGE